MQNKAQGENRLKKERKKRVPESHIQHYAISHLELRGWLVIETHDAWHHPRHDGITDLIAVKHGFVVWIECKRPTWKPCPEGKQMTRTEASEREFQRKIRAAGGTHCLIRTEEEAIMDVEELDRRAEEYKRMVERHKEKALRRGPGVRG